MPNPINVTLFFLIHHSVYSHRCHPPKWTGPWLLLKIIFLMPGTGLYLSEIQNARSVQLLSHVRLFVTSWTAAHQASLSITNSRSLLKLMSIELVMPFNYLILCHPLLLPPSIFPSIRVFSNGSVLTSGGQSIGVSASASVLPVQGTLRSLSPTPQFKSINSSALSFLYSPTLTSIHDYWKNHSFD